MRIFTLLILGLLSLTACNAPEEEAGTPPNIIILLADDMGYSDLGCMGSEIQTPNLDQLAREGVLMTHFYTTSRCCPSRASILTGQYAHSVGMGHMNSDWHLPAYRGFLNDQSVTIAEVLQTAGYRTLMSGKWHIGDERPHWPIDGGFERFYGIPAGGGVYFWPPVGLERPVYINETLVEPDTSWYSTDAFTDYAIEFIKEAEQEEKPFFLYAPYIAPHFPLQAWPEDIAKYEDTYQVGFEAIRVARFQRQQVLGVLPPNVKLSPPDFEPWAALEDPAHEAAMMAVYAAMVDRLDQNIGRLVQALKSQGLFENTVIFFLSDNGGCPNGLNRTPEAPLGGRQSFVAYGQSWANVSNTPYRKYKAMEEEGGVLTPLIAHWPAGLEKKGLITHEPAHLIDFMATCLELAGASYPEKYQGNAINPHHGQSFLPLLQGQTTDENRMLFWEHEGNKAVRRGPWKLVKSHQQDWALYNLFEDPTELNDLSAVHPDRTKALRSAYQAWAAAHDVRDWPVARE